MAGSKARTPRHPRYEILRRLGTGGTSSVFLAHDRLDGGREVALKICRLEVSPEEILREFRILRRLRHPGIARAFDCGRMPSRGAAYFTLEHVAGPGLEEHTRALRHEAGAKTQAQIISLFLQLTSALAYLHEKGLLHLDIKPANVIIADNRVKLIDFGLFQNVEIERRSPPRGTAYYMAPEVIDGGPIDHRADLYSLGVTLYRSLTGRMPISGRTVAEIAANHRTLVPPSPPGLPEALSRVILKMLAKSPRHRFQSARDVTSALESVVPGAPLVAAPQFEEPDFFGRKRELDAFFNWFSGMKQGRGQRLLVFEGEAGIGKSRLAEACATEMLDLSTQVVPIKTHGERDQDGLRQVIEKILVLHPASPTEERRWRFLLTFLGIASDKKTHREIKDLDLGSIESRVFHEALDVLAARSAHPLVFVIEDLGASDPRLVQFLRTLSLAAGAETQHLRVGILATRTISAGIALPQEEFEAPAVKTVRMGELTREEGLALLNCVAPTLSTAEANRIVKAGRGNPALLLEKLRDDRPTEESSSEDSPRESQVSEALAAAYAARVRELTTTERKALIPLVLAERPLSEATVRGLAKLDRKECSAVIQRLARSGLLGGTKAGYHVTHRARATVVAALESAEIQSAHDLLGVQFLKDPRSQREAAHHLLRAGRLELGLQSAERSVDALRAAGRIEEAIATLRDALEHVDAGHDRARLLERLGDLEARSGRFDAAGAAFNEALAFHTGDPTARLRLLRKIGGIHQRRGENEASRKAFDEALGIVEAVDDLGEQLYLFQELSAFHLFRGDFAKASTFANRGLEILASKRSKILRKEEFAQHALNFHSAAGHVFLRQFEYEQASRELVQGLKHAEKLGAVSNAALLWNNLGIAYSQDNRLGEALQAYRRAGELSRSLGDNTAVFSIQCNMATLQARLGKLQAAEEALRIAGEMPHAGKSLRAKLFLTHTKGLVERIALRDSKARWDATIQIADELPDPLFAAYGRLCQLENDMHFGRWGLARSLGEQLSGRKGKDPHFDRAINARLACLTALCGLKDEARTILETSIKAQGSALYVDLWDSVYQGQALLELGDLKVAEALLTTTRAAFERSHQWPSVLECAMLLADLALRRRDAPAAAKHLRSAAKALAAHDCPGGSRRANVRMPYLSARLALLTSRGDRGELEDRIADAVGSLEPNSTSEVVWLLALVAAETGDPMRARKANALKRSFAARLASRDREAYLARDHRARLGLLAQHSMGYRDATESQASLHYEAIVKLAQIQQPSQALQVVLEGAEAKAGAVFLSDTPRAAIAHGLAQRSEAELEDLRRQALEAESRDSANATFIPLRIHSGARGVLYLELAPQKLEGATLHFLETAAALLANVLPPTPRSRDERRDLTGSLTGARASTITLSTTTFGQTESPRMKELLDWVLRTRGSELPVLILGESGSGKDYLARYIHSLSPRAKGPFIAQDCASVPEGLLEADIFGYASGAFTGAERSKTGYIFAANGGTYYLDNVDSLSLESQAKLLRVLEEKSVRPLGSTVERKTDVRVIASSQHDLKELSLQGAFRKDLYYRLAGINLHVPPLRERAEDIPLLLHQIQRQVPGKPIEFKPQAIDALKRHAWPGNVRELETVVRRLSVTTEGAVDETRVAQVLGNGDVAPSFPRWLFEGKTFEQAIEEVKREYLLDLFERHAGDLAEIAKEMHTTKRNVYFRFAQVGIKPVDLRGGLA